MHKQPLSLHGTSLTLGHPIHMRNH